MLKVVFVFLTILLIYSCSSGRAALKKGDYYEAVLESVNRLRSSAENKKAKAVLSQGYPLAIQYIDATIQNGISSDDPMKWRNAVRGYEQVNYMNEQIRTSLGAMKIIAQPVTRFNELADAKKKAAEEVYQAGVNAMMKNTREDAKQAYFNFKEAGTYEPGYREAIEMMTQAEFNATLRVAYEEINQSRINYGSLQPVVNSLQRQFLSFKPITQKDTVQPHQYLRIIFDGYRGDAQPSTSTSAENLTREIKTGEKKGPDGKPQDILEKITAKITYFHKSKSTSSHATITISDGATQGVLKNEAVEGFATWQYDWAIYSGDIRALTTNQQNLCKRKEGYPNDEELFRESIRKLESNLGSQLRSFYSRY